mgnify:CR=1 FL=1
MSKVSKLPLGPSALFITSLFFIGVVFWGLFNETEIVVKYVDAGPVDRFATVSYTNLTLPTTPYV